MFMVTAVILVHQVASILTMEMNEVVAGGHLCPIKNTT